MLLRRARWSTALVVSPDFAVRLKSVAYQWGKNPHKKLISYSPLGKAERLNRVLIYSLISNHAPDATKSETGPSSRFCDTAAGLVVSSTTLRSFTGSSQAIVPVDPP